MPFLLKDIGAGIADKRTSSASRAFADAQAQLVDLDLQTVDLVIEFDHHDGAVDAVVEDV